MLFGVLWNYHHWHRPRVAALDWPPLPEYCAELKYFLKTVDLSHGRDVLTGNHMGIDRNQGSQTSLLQIAILGHMKEKFVFSTTPF